MKKTLAVVMVVVASLAITQPVSASRLPKERKATVEDLAATVSFATADLEATGNLFVSVCYDNLNRPSCSSVMSVFRLTFGELKQALGSADKRSIKGKPNPDYLGSIPKSAKKPRERTLAATKGILVSAEELDYWLAQPESLSFTQGGVDYSVSAVLVGLTEALAGSLRKFLVATREWPDKFIVGEGV